MPRKWPVIDVMGGQPLRFTVLRPLEKPAASSGTFPLPKNPSGGWSWFSRRDRPQKHPGSPCLVRENGRYPCLDAERLCRSQELGTGCPARRPTSRSGRVQSCLLSSPAITMRVGQTGLLPRRQRYADPRVPDKHTIQTYVGQSCANILLVGKAKLAGLG